jgi:hypothetical protein
MRTQRGARAPGILSVVAALVVALIFTAATPKLGAQIPFGEAKMIVEVNSTDGDAGIQVFLDGEAWESVAIVSPDGRRILEVTGKGSLGKLGLTELFSESQEPSFDELPLEEFLEMFSAGEYQFFGKTVEGETLVGTATFTHNIPAGPIIVSPREGAVVNPNNTVIVWMPVTRPRGIEIGGYQVIVEREEPTLLVFSVHLPATATSVTVPREFLESRTEYKFEVLAIEAGGNQTISESFFETR